MRTNEDKILFQNYLNNHYWEPWKKNWSGENKGEDRLMTNSLELIISPVCNTKCSYCYYKNFGDELYPLNASCGKDNLMNNLRTFLSWLNKEKMEPPVIEIFSGEVTSLPYFTEMMEYILNNYKGCLSIPTNATFLLNEGKTKRVEDLLNKYPNRIHLSFSIDGKYLDNETRQLRNGILYDDDYYEKAFTFGKKYRCGYHPMIGPKGIDKWCENLEWYVENLQKYYGCTRKEAFNKIYLLEVRNPDWTSEELSYLRKFIHYLVDVTFKCYDSPEDYVNNFLNKLKMNIFSSFVSSIGRGLGCSLQQCFHLRLSDLILCPCHRTSYKGYNACTFSFDKDLNMDFIEENPWFLMYVNNYDQENTSECIDCTIRSLCSKACIGCNYEVTEDFFITPDTVCDLEKAKTFATVEAFEEKGLMDYIIQQSRGYSGRIFREKTKELVNLQRIIRKENEKV